MVRPKELDGDCTMTIEDVRIDHSDSSWGNFKMIFGFFLALLCLPFFVIVQKLVGWRILDKFGKEEEPIKRRKAFLGEYDSKKHEI